jgi:hypothetical protein
VDASVAALAEHGPGFSIGAAHGAVEIPAEGSDTAAVLQLADQRLYARKEQRRTVPEPVVRGAMVADPIVTVPHVPGMPAGTTPEPVAPDVAERRFSRR